MSTSVSSLTTNTVEIPLTRGKTAIVDAEDFERVSQYKWSYHNMGYAFTNPGPRNGKTYILMHRFVNNTPVGLSTDHINANKLDNRKSNLRNADHAQNKWNKPKQANNTSGYKGVCFHRQEQKWRARIVCRGRSYSLGLYDTAIEASEAYNKKANELFGEFAPGAKK